MRIAQAPKNAQKQFKRNVLGTTRGHILVKNMWSDSQVVPGVPPSHYTRPQECPKIFLKNRTWYHARRHVCAKARLRNPEPSPPTVREKPRPDTPSWARTPCPGGGGPSRKGGPGSKGGRCPDLWCSSACTVKKRGNTTSCVPPTSRDPSHFPSQKALMKLFGKFTNKTGNPLKLRKNRNSFGVRVLPDNYWDEFQAKSFYNSLLFPPSGTWEREPQTTGLKFFGNSFGSFWPVSYRRTLGELVW